MHRSPRLAALALVALVAVALLLLAGFSADTPEPNRNFSFIVFGDSRLPGYVPYSDDGKVRAFFGEVVAYAYGRGANYHLDTAYQGGHLSRAIFTTSEGTTTMNFAAGWPTTILSAPPGGPAVETLNSSGQQWVYNSILDQLARGAKDPSAPAFAINTGDITYTGLQGMSVSESPYWRDFNDRFFSRLPPGGPDNLPGRFFPAPGNHEVWEDDQLQGLTTTVPYLKSPPLYFTPDRRIYSFDFRGVRFIFLDTGYMDWKCPSRVHASHPDWNTQQDYLKAGLNDAVSRHIQRVFITFHNPTYSGIGAGPIPDDQNPHALIESFADKLDIVVLNGHVHTTEVYRVNGVRYLVLGNGGGEQDFVPCEKKKYPDCKCPKPPADLYDNKSVEEYNYLEVRVTNAGVQMLLHRIRYPDWKETVAEMRWK